MIVRKCSGNDLPRLTQFNKHLIEDEQSDNAMSEQELYHRMEGFLETEYDAYFFEVEGDVVGYALVKNSCEPLYLRQFYIDRPYRRKHYGEQAFRELLDFLKVDTIDIEVLTWNDRGMSFWKKLGFKALDEQERCVYMRFMNEYHNNKV